MEELTEIIKNIIGALKNFDVELKEGNFSNVKTEVNKIFIKHLNYLESNYEISNSANSGFNFRMIGLTSQFLFPYGLYFNNFRAHILNKLEVFIKKEFTFTSFTIFLSKEIFATTDVKKGGFNERTLELLRFYIHNYGKVLDNSYKKFVPVLSTYTPKYHELSYEYFQTRFHQTQKYVRTNFIPDFFHFSLSGSIMQYNEEIMNNQELRGNLFGMLYDDKKNLQFRSLCRPFKNSV